MNRIYPRPIFLSGERLPVVVFFTSSTAKYFQAKSVFEPAGLRLTHRAHDSEPYSESYAGTKEELLANAIEELHRRGGASGSLFFVEDTSIRIEALSPGDEDRPGLAAKEWFEETSFESLHGILAERGDFRAIVKSCIALAVPGLRQPLYFYGETSGSVAAEPAVFEANPLYPWLSPDNFSAWFIPDGATRTLAEMSFEESLEYDFRVQAFMALIDRLEEFAIIMNAKSPVYARRDVTRNTQATLFSIEAPILLVVGPTCAGKTTFGLFVQQTLDWDVVDASSIVRLMRDERGRMDDDISDFAHQLLSNEGADVVARYIASKYVETSWSRGLVITGFRAIEEIEFFREAHPQVRVISIETPMRVRYERYLRRGTRKELGTFEEFRLHDERQFTLGLLRVASVLSDVRIANVYSESVYFEQIASVLGQGTASPRGITQVSTRLDPERSQLYRCLVVLRSAGRPLTTQEIQGRFPAGEASVRYNNANKMLKRYPEFAVRQEGPSSNVKYRVTETGLAFISAVDRLSRAAG